MFIDFAVCVMAPTALTSQAQTHAVHTRTHLNPQPVTARLANASSHGEFVDENDNNVSVI